MKPLISIIVTCKNRLAHLQQTLPYLVTQSHSELIVVNYGCTENTSEWIYENYPSVKVIEVNDDPIFNLTRARNIGAKNARGKILLLTDADVYIKNDLGSWIYENAKEGDFLIAPKDSSTSVSGTVICSKSDFMKIGGYDEAFQGWGWEDLDLYIRFAQNGIEEKNFSGEYLSAIEHADKERQILVEQGGHGSKTIAMTIGRVYTSFKKDIYTNTGQELDLETRKELMEKIKIAVYNMFLSPQQENQLLEVQLGYFENEHNLFCKKKLTYEFYKAPPK